MVCATCTQQLVLASFDLKTRCSITDADVECLAAICQLGSTNVRMDRAYAIFCTVIVPVLCRMHLPFVYCNASAANVMYSE